MYWEVSKVIPSKELLKTIKKVKNNENNIKKKKKEKRECHFTQEFS